MRLPAALPFVLFRFPNGEYILLWSRRTIQPARERMRRIAEAARDLAVPQADSSEQSSITVQLARGERQTWPINEEAAIAIYHSTLALMREK